MAKYSHRMVPEILQTFWPGMAAGEFITGAAEVLVPMSVQDSRHLVGMLS